MSTNTSTLTEREPAAVVGVVVPFVVAVIGLLAAFGVDITDEQRTAIVSVVITAFAVAFLVAALIRRKVTPTGQVIAALDGKTGEAVAGDASPLPTGLILEPGATVEDITP